MNLQLFTASEEYQHRIGATSVRWDDDLLVIGGELAIADHIPNLYLHVAVMHVPTVSWRPSYVLTNGHWNRVHAAAALSHPPQCPSRILVFGGGTAPTASHHDTLQIQRGGLDVLKIQTHSSQSSPALAAQGLSATAMAKNIFAIFGGRFGTSTYLNELHLFIDDSRSVVCIAVDTSESSARPAPRAFHTAALVRQTMLVICGGESDHQVLTNDLWMIDLAALLHEELIEHLVAPPVDEEAGTGKGHSKGGKGKHGADPLVLSAHWQRISTEAIPNFDSLFPPLTRHSVIVNSQPSDAEQKLLIFGGLRSTGLCKVSKYSALTLAMTAAQPPAHGAKKADKHHHAAPQMTLTLTEVSIHQEFIDCTGEKGKKLQALQAKLQVEEGALVNVAPIFESDYEVVETDSQAHKSALPLGWLFIGGHRSLRPSRNSIFNHCLFFLARDAKHPLIKKINKLIAKVNNGNPLFDLKDDDADKRNRKKRIKYPNGDVYYGEVAEVMAIQPSIVTETSVGWSQSKEEELDEDEMFNENGDPNIHIPHGDGEMQYAEGALYQGLWESGKRHGLGKLRLTNGDLYEGTFRQDYLHDHGQFVSGDGKQTYTGCFSLGLFDGHGEWKDTGNGEEFVGGFKAGRRNGTGIRRFPAIGCECNGSWLEDEMVGEGFAARWPILSYNVVLGLLNEKSPGPAGESSGSYQRKSSNTTGLAHDLPYPSAEQAVWQGIFSADVRGWYTGSLLDGRPHADEAPCIYEDGSEYIGGWRAGKRNGNGKYLYRNGDSFEGKWVGDVRCGFGRLMSFAGNSYEGQFERNVLHGNGIMKYKIEGTYYIGEFKHGQRCGKGRMVDEKAQKIIEEGVYLNDLLINDVTAHK